jgi:hypothetical protein
MDGASVIKPRSSFTMDPVMKKLILLFCLFPSISLAAEAFECSKKEGDVVCKANQDNIAISSIVINGGECESPYNSKLHHKVMRKGDKFVVPGAKECFYVRSVHINTHDGKTHHHNAM